MILISGAVLLSVILVGLAGSFDKFFESPFDFVDDQICIYSLECDNIACTTKNGCFCEIDVHRKTIKGSHGSWDKEFPENTSGWISIPIINNEINSVCVSSIPVKSMRGLKDNDWN